MVFDRLDRLARLLTGRTKQQGIHPRHFFWQVMEALLLLADILFIPEMLMALNRVAKPNTRRLTEEEIALARSVFGKNLDVEKVRIDDRAQVGCRKYHFAYVGFCVVNSWGKLGPAIFLHELVHVWQFQQSGSVYIPRALWAQRTPMGYDYGGLPAIQKAAGEGRGLEAFNFEQQGDVVADYFRLRVGEQPRWCAGDASALPWFEALMRRSFPG